MKDNNQKNPWKTLSGEEKYDNRWINVTEFQVINPGGGRGIYGKVHFKNLAVGVVALDEEMNTWLVGQYRYTLDQWSWEIPEGGAPMNEDPLGAAKRELQEETGLKAKRWKEIVKLHTSNSVTDETGFVYLAEELTEGITSHEETEADMKIWKLPLREAVKMVEDGKITDSLSVMGLLMVARMKSV